MGALDQFKGGYQINETLNDSLEQTTDPLKNLEGEELKFDGGGLFNTKKKEEEFIEPEDMIDPSLNQNEEDIEEDYHKQIEDMSDTGIEGDILDETKNNEELKDNKIKEAKEYPLVKNFLEERNIGVDNLSLDKDGKIDVNSIEGLTIDDKDMLNGLLVNIEGDNRMQNIIDLSESINDISEFDGYDKEISDNGFSDGVLNKIGENYIKIPNTNGEIDNIKNIGTAIELTKNEICLEAKNFNRDSQTYKTAIVNIESGNLKKQLEGINSLYYLAYSSEGKLGAKNSLKLHKDKRKKELISDANILENKIQQALKNGNEKDLKKLDKEKDKIISEVEELVKGDIFEAGDLDKISDDLNEVKEAN